MKYMLLMYPDELKVPGPPRYYESFIRKHTFCHFDPFSFDVRIER
jgi:hypothetical protein